MARTKHTAKSTGYNRERMNDHNSNDDDSSDLEKKSTGDKRKQRDEFSEDERDYIQVGHGGNTYAIDYDGPPIWEGIWEKFLPKLTQWADPMPLVKFGFAESKQIGLSEDGIHICVPIFYSNDPPNTLEPCTIMQIPIPEVIDMAFFQKLGVFIAQVLNSTSSNFYYIRWHGLYENVICINRDHIQHVTGFSDVIMERVVHSIHVVLGDWSGYMSLSLDNGSFACLHFTDRFFTDEHLTRTRTQQDLMAKKTRLFSTKFSVNIRPHDPSLGQVHGCHSINYRR
jgi:hypothetical protein